MPAERIAYFDTWQAGYGLATVFVYRPNTTTEASVFTDEALTIPIAQPITLLTQTIAGVSFGKWPTTVYVGEAYELRINSVDSTGIVRPGITTLAGETATGALVTPTGANQALTLANHLARRVDVRDYGVFLATGSVGASSSTNTTTLTAALGAASALGGGFVEVPEGVYAVTTFTVPQGVVLRGRGRGATTLQSTEAGLVATLGGAKAGFERITLDGVSLVAGSTGVYGLNRLESVFDDVEIKRFETGLRLRGGGDAIWTGLYITNCVSGALLYGDTDAGNTSQGAALADVDWRGGEVSLCSTIGIELKNVDAQSRGFVGRGIRFDTNTGTAFSIIGGRNARLEHPTFVANTTNVYIDDGNPVTVENTVRDVTIEYGRMSGGEVDLRNTLERVVFRRIEFTNVDIILTTPGGNVLAEDCLEDSAVTLSGVTVAWTRSYIDQSGETSGVTTGATATKAWAIALIPGQHVYLEAKVVGRSRNSVAHGFYHIAVSARRPGSALVYDSQTANFTVGDIVTGATSGATARITADSDSGTSGTLTVQDISGVFVDNEIITDTSGGSATVNGALTAANAALVGSVTAIRAAEETVAGWDATFVANGFEIELRVTGAASTTVEWIADVATVSS